MGRVSALVLIAVFFCFIQKKRLNLYKEDCVVVFKLNKKCEE